MFVGVPYFFARIRACFRWFPTVRNVEGRVAFLVCLLRDYINHAIRFRLGGVGDNGNVGCYIHATTTTTGLKPSRLSRRDGRCVGGGLVVAFHVVARLMQGAKRRCLGALRGHLRVSALRFARRFDSIRADLVVDGFDVGEGRGVRRAVACFVVQGLGHVGTGLFVVDFCDRMATLVGREREVVDFYAVFERNENDGLCTVRRGTGVVIALFWWVRRVDEYAHLGPRITRLRFLRCVRGTREIGGPRQDVFAGVVTIVFLYRAGGHFLRDRFFVLAWPLCFQTGYFCGFVLYGTTRDVMYSVRTCVVRLIRIARRACLHGLNRSNRRGGAGVAIDTLRSAMRHFRCFPVLVRRILVRSHLGR